MNINKLAGFVFFNFNISLIIIHNATAIPARISNELKTSNQSVFYIGINAPQGLLGVIPQPANGRYNDVEPTYQKTFSLFTLSDELKNYLIDARYPGLGTVKKIAIKNHLNKKI